MDRERYWREQYDQLIAAGGAYTNRRGKSWDYTDRARDMFPRYNILNAILNEVESLVPADLDSLDAARALLASASSTRRGLLPPHKHPIEAAAVTDERQRCAAFVTAYEAAAGVDVAPLPFRRVLTTAEHKRLHEEFAARWGSWYGGYPNQAARQDPPTVTLHDAAMDAPDAYAQLRRALGGRGVDLLLELREIGDGCELALELASFCYNGAEGFWTVRDQDWMVYASHESSITFGGAWLIEHMRTVLPAWDRYIYKGWDPAAYKGSL